MADGKQFLYFLIVSSIIETSIFKLQAFADDPCNPTVYKSFSSSNIGSRNEKCNIKTDAICDFYLQQNWYSTQDSILLDHCPKGQCGVSYPAWMNGKHPTEIEGIVNRTVCIRMQSDCCKEQMTILVKNCSSFFVYNLKPMNICSSVYCIESTKPCEEPEQKNKNQDKSTTGTIGSLVKDGNDIIRYVEGSKDNSTVIAGSVLAGVIALVGVGIIIAIVLYKKSDRTRSRVNTNTNYEAPDSTDLPPNYYQTISDCTKVQVNVVS